MKKLLLLLFPIICNGQTFTNELIDIIPGPGTFNVGCIVYKPAGYDPAKKYPLVIFSHGMGEAGLNLSLLYNAGLPMVLKNGYKPSFDFIMVAPQRSSYSVASYWLPSILDESIKRWSIDTDRIYLTGLSAGGWAAYGSQLNEDTILAKRIAAIVVASAATQDANKNNFDWWKISRTPIWAVAGESDISYKEQNQYMISEINKRVPGVGIISVVPGGHGIFNSVYNGSVLIGGKNMYEWMYQFKRGETSVTLPPVSIPFTLQPGAILKLKFLKDSSSYLIFEWIKD